MALSAASSLSPAASSFPIFKGQRRQLRSSLAIHARKHPTSLTYSIRIPIMAQSREPPEVMICINIVREKLWDITPRLVKEYPWKKAQDTLLQQLWDITPRSVKEFPWKKAQGILLQQLWDITPRSVKEFPWKKAQGILLQQLWDTTPRSVKEFPWKKAQGILLQRLLIVGKMPLKWSLFALYVCSSVSDVLYSISRNKELMIPFGLFVGCLMTNIFIETSQELFPAAEEREHLVGIGCIFAVLKIIAASFAVPGCFFLLHTANGGLMQVLWLWKSLAEKQQVQDDTSVQEVASTS